VTQPEKTFPQALEELTAAFVNDERTDETDKDIGQSIFEFVLNYERLRRHVNAGSAEEQLVDQQTTEKIRTWDSDDPAMLVVEKALRRLADGRGEDGIRLLRTAIKHRAEAFSEKQTAIAKLPRKSRQQPMAGLVEQIVLANPGISQNNLLHALRQKLGDMDMPPYTYSGTSFRSLDKRFLDIETDALRQYLYRAKKKHSL
jgi:hypothetical protein